MRSIGWWPRAAQLAAAALTLAASGGSIASGALAGGTASVASHSAHAGRRFTDSAGWWVRFPASWRVEQSGSSHGGTRVDEVTFATFRARAQVHVSARRTRGRLNLSLRVDPPLDAAGRFPSTGVAFRILVVGGFPYDFQTDSHFPLGLAGFVYGAYYGQPQGVPAPVHQQVWGDGSPYDAAIWIGARASQAARRQLARIVASLRFPHPRYGTMVGPHDFVLHRPAAYPVGSLRDLSRLHVVLIHAPGGFYGLRWGDPHVESGYAGRCDGLRIDRPRKQLVCTNLPARWDRVGRVLARPAGSREDPLPIVPLGPAWDGHLLLENDWNIPLTSAVIGGLDVIGYWPHWTGS